MKQMLKNNKILAFLNEKKNAINIASLLAIIVSLFLSCFLKSFVWVTAVIVCLSAIVLFDKEKCLGLLVFFVCFRCVINLDTNADKIFSFIRLFLFFIVGILYLISLIKKEKKINLKLLIPAILFIIYVSLPIHKATAFAVINLAATFALLYIIFEERKEISFKYILEMLCYGLIVSAVFALFRGVSERLDTFLPYVSVYKYLRFSGMYTHPNHYAAIASLAICGLLYLKYEGKISLPKFFLLFIPLFIFGYKTISRNYLLVIGAAFIIFFIMYIIKKRKNSWKFLLRLCLSTIAILGIFFIETKIYLVRLNILPYSYISSYVENSDVGETIFENGEVNGEIYETEHEKFSDEWWQDVYNGTVRYDPGREELRREYISDWSSTLKTIMFGRGISANKIGQLNAHNLFIQELWMHGLVGVAFYLAFFICMIDFKKLKNAKRYLPLLLLIVPYLILILFEAQTNDYVSFIIFNLSLGFVENKFKEKSATKKVLYYNSTLGQGGTENYMVNLIENMDSQKFKFDVLIKTEEGKSEDLETRLKAVGANITYLGNSTAKQIINGAKFLSKNGNNYDVMHINATSGAVGIFAYLGKDFGGIEKVIFHSHMGGSDNKDTTIDKFGKLLAKNFSDKLASCSVVASEFMYGKKYVNKHKIAVLNNAINISNFKFNKKVREAYRKLLGVEDKFVIFNLGRFAPQKNQIRLIEIFAEIKKKEKNVALIIVGAGPLEEEIKNKISELKLQKYVKLLGERNDVNNIMQAADVFVMTSIHEGLPIIAVETQASGLPLVLSSSITKDSDLTGNCKFVDLESDNKTWAEEILSLKSFKRQDTSKLIQKNNFDNESAAKVIETIY